MQTDLERLSSLFDVPLKYSPSFVDMMTKGTLRAMRVLTAVRLAEEESGVRKDKVDESLLVRVTRELWKCVWESHEAIASDEDLVRALQRASLSETGARQMVASSKEQHVKQALKAMTSEAIERGTFGVPTFVFETPGKDMMFFGSDRFEAMAHVLGLPWYGPRCEDQSRHSRL